MIDRKQVMYDIEKCICNVPGSCMECSHYTGTVGFVCMESLLADVLALLKEQESVEPRIQTSGSGVTWWNVCGNCQTAINPNDKYCHECGRPVKWE